LNLSVPQQQAHSSRRPRRKDQSVRAADRMVRRGLIPDDGTISQLNAAFDLASQKGSREALFLLDDLAVIASVPNRTVKTALGRTGLQAGVFTHIDAAIVMSQNPQPNIKNNESINQSPRSNGWTSNEGAAVQRGGNQP
jgi:flagellar operon protein